MDDVDWTGPVDGGRHDEKRDPEEDYYKYTEDLGYWIRLTNRCHVPPNLVESY